MPRFGAQSMHDSDRAFEFLRVQFNILTIVTVASFYNNDSYCDCHYVKILFFFVVLLLFYGGYDRGHIFLLLLFGCHCNHHSSLILVTCLLQYITASM